MQYFRMLLDVLGCPDLVAAKLPKQKGYRDAALFTAITTLIGTLPITLFSSLVSFENLTVPLRVLLAFLITLVASALSPALALIQAWILQHVLLLLGGKGRLDGSFRAVAFASAPKILLSIPFINLAAGIWSIVLSLLFLSKVHNVSLLRALAAFLILILFVTLIALIIIFALIPLIALAAGEL